MMLLLFSFNERTIPCCKLFSIKFLSLCSLASHVILAILFCSLIFLTKYLEGVEKSLMYPHNKRIKGRNSANIIIKKKTKNTINKMMHFILIDNDILLLLYC